MNPLQGSRDGLRQLPPSWNLILVSHQLGGLPASTCSSLDCSLELPLQVGSYRSNKAPLFTSLLTIITDLTLKLQPQNCVRISLGKAALWASACSSMIARRTSPQRWIQMPYFQWHLSSLQIQIHPPMMPTPGPTTKPHIGINAIPHSSGSLAPGRDLSVWLKQTHYL